MKKIKLNTTQIDKEIYTLVSDEDFDWLNQWKWSLIAGGYAYRRQHFPSSRKNQRCKVIYMHRLIMDFPDALVDHKDRNRLNNQRDNLRPVTYAQNALNSNIRNDNTSGHKGITFSSNRWWARIWVNSRAINLGRFRDKQDAVKAREEAEIKYYGCSLA